MNIEQEILEIRERNKKVEADKAWEISFARRFFISAVTYVFAFWWLFIIAEPKAWLKAFVPVIGYILSTLSLSIIKDRWKKNHK